VTESVLNPGSEHILITIEVPSASNVDKVEREAVEAVKRLRREFGDDIGIMNVASGGYVDWQ